MTNTRKPNPSKATLPQSSRIRDNQRRSRARRKEYLSSLESKLSHCERVGVEASVEIQNAAKKVLEENRRLRSLLREFGVVEDGASGKVLEGLLAGGGRRACAGGEARAVSAAPGNIASRSLSIPTDGANLRPVSGAVDDQPDHQYTLMTHVGNGMVRTEMISQPEWDYMNSISGTAQDEPPLAPHIADATSQQPNCSSCKSVATAIRAIRPDIGTELEEDLGCEVDDTGDCSVPNTKAFDVLDRYSDERG